MAKTDAKPVQPAVVPVTLSAIQDKPAAAPKTTTAKPTPAKPAPQAKKPATAKAETKKTPAKQAAEKPAAEAVSSPIVVEMSTPDEKLAPVPAAAQEKAASAEAETQKTAPEQSKPAPETPKAEKAVEPKAEPAKPQLPPAPPAPIFAVEQASAPVAAPATVTIATSAASVKYDATIPRVGGAKPTYMDIASNLAVLLELTPEEKANLTKKLAEDDKNYDRMLALYENLSKQLAEGRHKLLLLREEYDRVNSQDYIAQIINDKLEPAQKEKYKTLLEEEKAAKTAVQAAVISPAAPPVKADKAAAPAKTEPAKKPAAPAKKPAAKPRAAKPKPAASPKAAEQPAAKPEAKTSAPAARQADDDELPPPPPGTAQ